jgi:DNA-binding NtrC family response regulator
MSKHTILLVDDDKLILNTLQKRFSTWDLDVHSANTPEEAKDLLAKLKQQAEIKKRFRKKNRMSCMP